MFFNSVKSISVGAISNVSVFFSMKLKLFTDKLFSIPPPHKLIKINKLMFITEIVILSCRVELYRTGVTVHVLEPSGYRTNFVVSNNIINALASRYQQLDDERKNYYGENFLNLCKFQYYNIDIIVFIFVIE